MFTGLVEGTGKLAQVLEEGPGIRLVIHCGQIAEDVNIGDSICISGCCLTVVERQEALLSFQAGSETLAKTTLGKLSMGDSVNLERSLQVGARLGGHFVTGHVDGVGRAISRKDESDWSYFEFEVPSHLSPEIAPKGSVAVNGVSLTVVNCERNSFSVALIPHTLAMTNLGTLSANASVNIETDVLAKYVRKAMESVSAAPTRVD